jgi:hypothetical protein
VRLFRHFLRAGHEHDGRFGRDGTGRGTGCPVRWYDRGRACRARGCRSSRCPLRTPSPATIKKPTQPYWELYDLRRAPHETEDVVADPKYAETLQGLKRQLAELQRQLGDKPVDAGHDGQAERLIRLRFLLTEARRYGAESKLPSRFQASLWLRA